MTKTALITGATSGIGKATAEMFADHGINLVICGRRQERLDELRNQLSEKVKVHTLSFDVRDKKDVFAKLENLPQDFSVIDILVNNAGNAHGLAPIQDGDVDDWDAMIDINVKGLLYVSKAIIDQMKERKSGHIINIGSIAGKDVYPNGNVYNASKFAVNALNEAMRYDLNEFGIRVGAVHPGLVHTEFSEVRFKGDSEKAENVYKGYTPLYAEDIADIIYFMVSRKGSVNIADLVVYPTAQASATILNKKV
ncbi:SDR family NAD(P)-dependent oxidoreductase [Flammeovirga agarivorans]|uniref:SDR family NAD(P)-dependent oxidoreductase n=1 Tax=Flammeovirga agarivorans TaxID=2726742 RepID=A0A7X8SH95_9BACT|nr:SDR family NAD(P)-dependent oxidoreductase [Flammeovirga agarivorans]NLR90097.1 SDR family NAD(P)-dependent oxidoreductase [Flammeovirga agarivorans]